MIKIDELICEFHECWKRYKLLFGELDKIYKIKNNEVEYDLDFYNRDYKCYLIILAGKVLEGYFYSELWKCLEKSNNFKNIIFQEIINRKFFQYFKDRGDINSFIKKFGSEFKSKYDECSKKSRFAEMLDKTINFIKLRNKLAHPPEREDLSIELLTEKEIIKRYCIGKVVIRRIRKIIDSNLN